MEIFFLIIAIIVTLVGLVGSVAPVLPGTPLNFLAIVILYFLKDGLIGTWVVVLFGVLTVVAMLVDYVLPVMKVRKFGASRHGILGLFIGMALGFLVLSFVGMVIGAFLGTIFGELMSGKKPENALNLGLAAIWGFALTTLVKFGISLIMAIYFFVKLMSLVF